MVQEKECFYCKKKTKDNFKEKLTLYGITDCLPLPIIVYYNTQEISIDICGKCSNRNMYILLISFIGSFVISTAILIYYLHWFPTILSSILVTGLIVYITIEILEQPLHKHPEVKRLLDLNWRTSRPSKATFYQKDDYIKGS